MKDASKGSKSRVNRRFFINKGLAAVGAATASRLLKNTGNKLPITCLDRLYL